MARWPTEPVLGFRRWRVTQDGQLRALAVDAYWQPGVNEAQCLGQNITVTHKAKLQMMEAGIDLWQWDDPRIANYVTRNCEQNFIIPPGHPVPSLRSMCGIWAHKQPISPCQCPDPTTRVHGAVGVVRLWGRAIEHVHGWRSQFAEVVAIVDFSRRLNPRYDVPRYSTTDDMYSEWAPDITEFSPGGDHYWCNTGWNPISTYFSYTSNTIISSTSPPPISTIPSVPLMPPPTQRNRWYPGVRRPDKERRKRREERS
jgi:hypothetical protein